ncbi:hypothetical protein [Chenggangzhangella methanolivorans]|uniref:Uncharacterized protein n=1 Tax=Chenggangzhangella methanolivorans TaxID=1437009 RepID=A0A9E6RDE9_9HYPH|nr:hypothetical protein [Chenggangzhangella methanolivorans]QZN99030.1 hypothetical protein K6K41_19480 [Chenggangzhangella methanolivorans]
MFSATSTSTRAMPSVFSERPLSQSGNRLLSPSGASGTLKLKSVSTDRTLAKFARGLSRWLWWAMSIAARTRSPR